MSREDQPEDLAQLISARKADAEIADAFALTFYQGGKLRERLTYRELLTRVEEQAGWLHGALSVQCGDRVGLLSHNSVNVALMVLALMRLGAVAVPLNPGATRSELAYVLEHSGSVGVFASAELIGLIPKDKLRFALVFEELPSPEQGSRPPEVGPLAEQLATVLYTSGTTGRPKGVAVSHRNIMFNSLAMARNFELSRTTQFTVLPLYHAHAFGFGFMTAILTKGHLVFTDHFDPFAWTRIIREERVTATSVFPTLLPLLLRVRAKAADVPTLQHIMVTSSTLPRDLAMQFEEGFGLPLMHGWGLSETTCLSTCMPVHQDAELHKKLMRHWPVPSIGTSLEGIEVAVLDEAGQPVQPGIHGELCVRGPTLTQGYYLDREATAGAFRDGWFHSGDLGFQVVEGGKPYFFLVSRIKEIIIRGGAHYSPVAIEQAIVESEPELRNTFAIVGFEHALTGEEIGAYVEVSDADPQRMERFKKAVSDLPVLQRPKVILYGTDLVPRTHTGKIQRKKIQSMFGAYRNHSAGTKVVALSSQG